jgi:hypothetical protein
VYLFVSLADLVDHSTLLVCFVQPDIQPLSGENVGVEGDFSCGAGDFVQHHAGYGKPVPV